MRISILALGRKHKKKENPQSKKGRKQKRKENSQLKEGEKAEEKKRRKKIPDQRSEENRRNMQKGLWTRQYLNNAELSPRKQKKRKKGNHDLKWSFLFDCQPKSCASVTCSPRAKQKTEKEKRPKTFEAKNSHKKKTIPKKKSY